MIFKLFKKVAYPFRGRHLNRFKIVRTALNLTLRLIKPPYVIVDKNRMFLDKDDSMRLSIVGVYEPTTVKLLQKKVKKGDTVIDIGAHIGYYTLLAARRVGNKGKVYAFEPNKDNQRLLIKNLTANGYKNVEIIDKAVAEKPSKAKLFLSDVSTGMHSLINIDDSKESTIVDITSIDDFFGKKVPKVSVIKMDIEGGEYAATKGMRKLVKKNKNITLFTEFSPFVIKKSGKSPIGFLNLLKKYGFELYSVDEMNGEVRLINPKKFVKNFPFDRDWHINLMAIKK